MRYGSLDILRGAARMALGEPGTMAETQRDAVAAAKVRILHEGREGIERAVPALAPRGRRRKLTPPDAAPSAIGT